MKILAKNIESIEFSEAWNELVINAHSEYDVKTKIRLEFNVDSPLVQTYSTHDN